MKLVNFLYARIAEDERRADILRERQQRSGMWSENTWDAPDVDYPDSWSRILSECEAKRRIVTFVVERPEMDEADWYWALTRLALPYADHPDYQEKWRP